MRVFVYFNLHKKCLSVKAVDGAHRGKVIAHARSIHLKDVNFKVSEAGRQRVLAEKRKNVHAGVLGIIQSIDAISFRQPIDPIPECAEYLTGGTPITYNPYKFVNFVNRSTLEPVFEAKLVALNGRVMNAFF